MENGGLHLPDDEILLDRRRVPEEIEENLGKYVSYLDTLADWGVQFLKRVLLSSSSEISDLVLIALYRQVLCFLDSIRVLLSEGAVDGSIPTLRSLFETTIAIEWILENGKERWGRQFYVGELRQKRSWAAMFVPGEPEHQKAKSVAAGKLLKSLNDPKKQAEAQKQIDAIDDHLDQTVRLKPIADAFKQEKRGRPYEERWYCIKNGPGSIREIAEKLGREDEYMILYRQWSESSHASRTRGQVQMHRGDDHVVVEPIRSVENLDSVFNLARTFVERVTRLMVIEFRPGELKGLSEKVLDEWDEERRMPEIEVEMKTKDLR